jgi:hypothetical protein
MEDVFEAEHASHLKLIQEVNDMMPKDTYSRHAKLRAEAHEKLQEDPTLVS